MENTKTIKAMIEKMLQKIDEPEIIKSLGEINNQLDSIDKEHEELIQKHKDLKMDYANYIKSQPITNEEDKEEHNDPLSFEEYVAKIVLEKGEEF